MITIEIYDNIQYASPEQAEAEGALGRVAVNSLREFDVFVMGAQQAARIAGLSFAVRSTVQTPGPSATFKP
jgi:hypothetical protein